MIDADELHRLWIGGVGIREIARRLHTTTGVVERALRRLRRDQGTDRWPPRAGAIQPNPSKARRPPKRAGASTLPPLDSLR